MHESAHAIFVRWLMLSEGMDSVSEALACAEAHKLRQALQRENITLSDLTSDVKIRDRIIANAVHFERSGFAEADSYPLPEAPEAPMSYDGDSDIVDAFVQTLANDNLSSLRKTADGETIH